MEKVSLNQKQIRFNKRQQIKKTILDLQEKEQNLQKNSVEWTEQILYIKNQIAELSKGKNIVVFNILRDEYFKVLAPHFQNDLELNLFVSILNDDVDAFKGYVEKGADVNADANKVLLKYVPTLSNNIFKTKPYLMDHVWVQFRHLIIYNETNKGSK
jgi:hypothetical protein